MILRALGFEEEVKRNELSWPNNYMSCADDLELFEGITNIKAGDPATRGDIAILLWNALRTGVAEIVAYNDKGVIYGEGTPMITEYLGYTYIEDADVTNIKFSIINTLLKIKYFLLIFILSIIKKLTPHKNKLT